MSYFEAREKELLGTRYDEMYARSESVYRGITRNPLRCSHETLMSGCLPLAPSPFCKEGYVLTNPDYKIGKHPYYHAGAFYVQEPSASAPAPLLCVQSGDRVLDMCSAPGGKASQLLACLGENGLLVANEYDYSRSLILRSNLERMGADNAIICSAPPAKLAAALPHFFDKILVDAPCSGEGMFIKEKAALAQHSEALVKQCAALGADILDSAADCLSANGSIVYSTCTFAKEEDEAQIGAFLARHSNFTLDKIDVAYGCEGEKARALAYDYNAEFTRRIYPCHCGEGHFIARLTRCANSFAPPRVKPPKYAKLGSGAGEFIRQYFPNLLKSAFIENDGKTVLCPSAAIYPPHVQMISAGVQVGGDTNGRFVPSHALFMAYGAKCTNKETLSLADERTCAWLRGEEISALTAQNGYCAVLVDGIPLGFGKVSSGKCKNHYPKGLRNLK